MGDTVGNSEGAAEGRGLGDSEGRRVKVGTELGNVLNVGRKVGPGEVLGLAVGDADGGCVVADGAQVSLGAEVGTHEKVDGEPVGSGVVVGKGVGIPVGEGVAGMSTKNAGLNASGVSPYTDLQAGSMRVQ